jgi:hypothetical protein
MKPEKHHLPCGGNTDKAKSENSFHRRWTKFHHFLLESDEKNLVFPVNPVQLNLNKIESIH